MCQWGKGATMGYYRGHKFEATRGRIIRQWFIQSRVESRVSWFILWESQISGYAPVASQIWSAFWYTPCCKSQKTSNGLIKKIGKDKIRAFLSGNFDAD